MAGPYDIFVDIWQSNNYSSYHYDAVRDVGHPRIFQMKQASEGSVIEEVTSEPLSYQGAAAVGVEGPPIGHILAFCRDYYLPNRLASGRNILIIPNAHGGTGFSNEVWGIVDGVGGSGHELTVSRVNAAMAANPGSVIKACLCQGGEADAFWVPTIDVNGDPTSVYTDLQAIHPFSGGTKQAFIDWTVAEVADFRARWTDGANVPFLFGWMSPKYYEEPLIGSAPGYKVGSQLAIEELPAHIANSIDIESTGLTTDNMKLDESEDIYGTAASFVHFDAESQAGSETQTNPFSKRYWQGFQELSGLHVHEITMAAPDIVCIEIRDEAVAKGALVQVEEDLSAVAYTDVIQRTNPITLEPNQYCQVKGPDKDYLKFHDTMPQAYLNRAACDVVGDWGAIGARTVTAVYRKAYVYDGGDGRSTDGTYNTQMLSMKHYIYLQLDGDLAEGSYTIDFPTDTSIANTPFVFDDKVTRCSSIHATQVGCRPSDVSKVGYLSVWVPGAPDEGAVAFAAEDFYVIDESGTEVAGPFDITERILATEEEAGFDLLWRASTEFQPLTATGVNTSTDVVTYTGSGWVPANGDQVIFRCTTGLGGLESARASISSVNTGAGTFVVSLDLTGYGTFATGYYHSDYEWKIYKAIEVNRAGTNVYGLDYSSWTTGDGVYRLYIPGLGVSDQFRVDDDVWWDVAKNSFGGLYNQRAGIALDGRFGYTRPIAHRGNPLKSRLPGIFASELSTIGSPYLSSHMGAYEPAITTDEVTDFYGTHNDAADWDSFVFAHTYAFYLMLDQLVEFAPAAVRSEGVFGTPKSSATLGVAYNGTDDLPDAFHEAAWMFDAYRRLQNPDGSVCSGVGIAGAADQAGAATNPHVGNGPSWLPLDPNGFFIYAPDHMSNYAYALAAAKMALVLYAEGGLDTLAGIWEASAIDAWDWAEPIYQDASGEYDAYYTGECNIMNLCVTEPVAIVSANTGTDVITGDSSLNIATGYAVRLLITSGLGNLAEETTYYARSAGGVTFTLHTTLADSGTGANPVNVTSDGTGFVYRCLTPTEYAAHKTFLQDTLIASTNSPRYAAAGALFRLTGDSAYESIADDLVGSGGNPWDAICKWEYYNATGGDEAVRDAYEIDFQTASPQLEAHSIGDVGYRNQSFSGVSAIQVNMRQDLAVWKLILAESDPEYLTILQNGRHFIHGANQNGLCITTGLEDAARIPTQLLHVDTLRSGFALPPPGITLYGWDPGFFAQFGNFSTDSPINGIVELPLAATTFDADFRKQAIWEPYRLAVPKFEFLAEHRYWVHTMEYTFHQTIVPEVIMSLYLSAHDGNEHTGEGGEPEITYNSAGLRFRWHT